MKLKQHVLLIYPWSSQIQSSQTRSYQIWISQIWISQIWISQIRISQIQISQIQISQIQISQIQILQIYKYISTGSYAKFIQLYNSKLKVKMSVKEQILLQMSYFRCHLNNLSLSEQVWSYDMNSLCTAASSSSSTAVSSSMMMFAI